MISQNDVLTWLDSTETGVANKFAFVTSQIIISAAAVTAPSIEIPVWLELYLVWLLPQIDQGSDFNIVPISKLITI